jgi:PAS domain S-box-containing protein
MIFLLEPDSQTLVWGASLGLSEKFVESYKKTSIQFGEGLTGTIAETKAPIFIQEHSSIDKRIARDVIVQENLHSFLGVPILAGGELVGVLNVLTRPPDILTEDNLTFCSTVGAQIGLAVRNAQLYARQKYLSDSYARQNEYLETLLQTTSDGFWIVNKDGYLIKVNQAYSEMTGYSEDELVKLRINDLDALETPEITAGHIEKIRRDGFDKFETVHRRKDGTLFDVEVTVNFLPREGGQLLCFCRDITERRQMEQQVLDSEHKLRTFVANHPGIVFITDREGVFQMSEGQGLAQLGLEPGQVVGLSAFDLYKDIPQICNAMKLCVELAQPQAYTVTVGTVRYETWFGPMVDNNGYVYGIMGIATDITERYDAEQELRKSLEEKKVLLAEIHHRVKNNLAIISSLLSLQSEFSTQSVHPDTILKDLRGRVLSMASVHELVYQSSNFAEISTDQLVRRIYDHLNSIYQQDNLIVDYSITSDDIMLDMNRSVPFSLFLNEALTNIWKHAFTGRQRGRITIDINKCDKGFGVTIQDNGVGVENMESLQNPASFGLTIIHGLVGQLKGELTFNQVQEGGLQVCAEFPFN